MATTTLGAIIDRWQAVLEAAPLSLAQTTQPFSFDTQPNITIDDRYWIEDAGLGESASVTGYQEVRLDQLRVWIARRLKFAGQTSQEAIETTLIAAERALVADGPANSYAAFAQSRSVEQIDGADVVIGALTMTVDYDYTLIA